MSEPLQVKVSRDGKEIGAYSVQEVVQLIANGALLGTDHYWHEGMTDWALLNQFDAGAALKIASRAIEEAKRRLEEVRREQSIRDAVEARMKSKTENYFTCNCCKDRFEKPKDPRSHFWKGLLFVFVGWWPGVIAFGLSGSGRYEPPFLIIIGLGLISLIITLQGFVLVLSSGLRSPYCPGCHSTDYSRPNRDVRSVFD